MTTQSTPALTLSRVRAGFGAQTIIHGVDLEVPAGEVTGLFGLNGAGKSVLLKVVAGVVPTWGGRIAFLGGDITSVSPERRVARGMGHVPQGRQVFPSLTVEQNLRVGGYVLDRRDRIAVRRQFERVYEMFPLLAERRRQYAGTLSGGQQAMLAVGRALISDPKVLLIDEPSAGLAPAVVEQLLESLLRIREHGLTMLLVEQNIRFGLQLSDRACLLQRGRIVYSGATDELDHDTMASYLGVGRLLSRDLSAGLGSANGKARGSANGKPRAASNRKPRSTTKRAPRT